MGNDRRIFLHMFCAFSLKSWGTHGWFGRAPTIPWPGWGSGWLKW
jgi:hypothetical protein